MYRNLDIDDVKIVMPGLLEVNGLLFSLVLYVIIDTLFSKLTASLNLWPLLIFLHLINHALVNTIYVLKKINA